MTLAMVVAWVRKVPALVWAAVALFVLALSINWWYNRQLDAAEALGAAQARVAFVRDSTHHVIAQRDSAAAEAKAKAAETTRALSASVARVRADNAKLRAALAQVPYDTLPTSTDSVWVAVTTLQAAAQLARDAEALTQKFITDSTAHATYQVQRDSVESSLRVALAKAEAQIPVVGSRPSFWQRAKTVTGHALQVVGAVALVVVVAKH